ncbi:MAG: Rpn family recombination-promoting nuclease/putative transposase [Deltaproteobacteria bacterium]|nr:Rpn family recombination-promoting nuclease/putative transposase [Deltaproteobacteria bacterium]
MGLWDVTFKRLLRLRPQDLLSLVPGAPADQPWRLCPTEFVPRPTSRMLDGCLDLEADPGGTLYHVEFEATPRSDTGRRVFEHFALVHAAHPGRAVRPVVFYLGPGEQSRRPQDRHVVLADGEAICDFRFDAVRLWEFDADELLARPAPALWSVVTLGRGAGLPHVARAVELLQALPDRALARELLVVLYLVAGTRFAEPAVRALLPEEVLMRSATYDAIVEQGRAQGWERGLAEGQVEGLRRACRRVAATKLGEIAPDLDRRLAEFTDPAALEALLVDLSGAADPPAALAVLTRALG